MKSKLTTTLLFLVAVNHSSCQDKKQTSVQTDTTNEAIHTLRSGLFSSYTQEKIKVADFIEHYLNLMYDSTVATRNALWDSKILTDQQDFFLKGGFEKRFLIQNSPQILGIRATRNQHYEVKLAIEQNGFVYKIMNLTVAFDGLNRPYFIDQLGENLTTFDTNSFKAIEFLYSPKATKSDVLEQKMAILTKKWPIYSKKPAKRPKIIVLKNLKDYCDVLGFDYMPFLTYDAQTGGIAMPKENILFSANNSPYYPHELVHLYTADFNPHYWFDEGCATYLGGSVEYPLEYHLKKIASQMDTLDFSNLPENKKLDDDINFKYALGGLFCKIAMDEYGGKKSLFALLNSGKTEEDFHSALRTVFGIEKENYDSFIREKLRKYKNSK